MTKPPRLILTFFLILPFVSTILAIRKDISLQDKQTCRTTVQGRFLLADDNGYVCDTLSLDPQSRCCQVKREKYTCSGCNLGSQCCNSYEFCVSCCLNPARTQKDLVVKVKIAKPVTAGTYSNVFDFCAGRCRHNSESVVHENAYLSDLHHCFGLPSNSSDGVSDAHIEVRLSGINVLIGKQGESCDSVCKSNGQSCVPTKLSLLNKCEIMQKYMSCRGACLASMGADQPAEVVENAPKDLITGVLKKDGYVNIKPTLIEIQEHAYIRKQTRCFPVMAHINIQGGSAPVHSTFHELFIKLIGVERGVTAMKICFFNAVEGA